MLLGAASFWVAGNIWSTSGSFCMAGPHSEHLRVVEHLCLVLLGSCSTWSTKVSFAWQVQHWTHLSWVLRGISLRLMPSTQRHLHYIIKHTIIKTTPSNTTSSTHTHTIYTTSSTHHHQHNLINTSPSSQHHLHNTSYTTQSTLHHQTLAGAALGALPYYPFCLMSEDTVNMWGCPDIYFLSLEIQQLCEICSLHLATAFDVVHSHW